MEPERAQLIAEAADWILQRLERLKAEQARIANAAVINIGVDSMFRKNYDRAIITSDIVEELAGQCRHIRADAELSFPIQEAIPE